MREMLMRHGWLGGFGRFLDSCTCDMRKAGAIMLLILSILFNDYCSYDHYTHEHTISGYVFAWQRFRRSHEEKAGRWRGMT